MTQGQHGLRSGRPIWLGGRAAARRHPTLAGQHDTDVVIVGGGITGALIAHAFSSAGVPNVVLEASRVGRGSTGASSALLLQEPDLELTQLVERYGPGASRRIWQLGYESVRGLIGLLRRAHVRCDVATRDAIYYATDALAEARLRAEHRLRRRYGFDVDWLSAGAIRRATGVPARGGLRTSGNAQFDPYRACVGVMHGAIDAGSLVFERSPVMRIETDRSAVRVRTRDGTVRAKKVIVATGYATSEFRPLAGRFRMYRTYVVATEAMNAAQRRDLGLTDVMLWDAERPYHYARWDGRHRLLLGGGDWLVQPGRHRRLATAATELRAHFERLLPGLAPVKTAAVWEGLFAMTPDSLPYVGPHRRYPHHWFALGYGGNGMTFGFLCARLLLERWQHGETADQRLFAFGRAAVSRR